MVQFARPFNDDAIGNWTNDVGGTTDIYQAIDEVTANDADYIESEINPSASTCEIELSEVDDPETAADHIVRYQYRRRDSGGGSPPTIDITVALTEGGVVRASQTHTSVSTTFTAGSFTLSAGEANSITDYGNLEVEFTANKTGGSRDVFGNDSWAEFEVPNAPGAGITILRRRR